MVASIQGTVVIEGKGVPVNNRGQPAGLDDALNPSGARTNTKPCIRADPNTSATIFVVYSPSSFAGKKFSLMSVRGSSSWIPRTTPSRQPLGLEKVLRARTFECNRSRMTAAGPRAWQ